MNVGFFVTCLVDMMRPSVGFAAVELLEQADCRVAVPRRQTCCGQPAWNSGDLGSARPVAQQVIDEFEKFDYVVVPSGSCAGMIRTHYEEMFQDDLRLQQRARALAGKTYELTSFLDEIAGVSLAASSAPGVTVTYHDSCSGLRELGVQRQPRRLLAQLDNVELVELPDSNVCCGFGGTFCVKYPEISTRLVNDKCDKVADTGAGVLLGGDLGCLLNIAGRMRRRGESTRVYHVAEWLAGYFEDDGIGSPAGERSR